VIRLKSGRYHDREGEDQSGIGQERGRQWDIQCSKGGKETRRGSTGRFEDGPEKRACSFFQHSAGLRIRDRRENGENLVLERGQGGGACAAKLLTQLVAGRCRWTIVERSSPPEESNRVPKVKGGGYVAERSREPTAEDKEKSAFSAGTVPLRVVAPITEGGELGLAIGGSHATKYFESGPSAN